MVVDFSLMGAAGRYGVSKTTLLTRLWVFQAHVREAGMQGSGLVVMTNLRSKPGWEEGG